MSKVIAPAGKVLLSLYLLSYAMLSWRGAYAPAAWDLRGVMWYGWAPAGCYSASSGKWTGLQYLYLPLLLVDHWYWHTHSHPSDRDRVHPEIYHFKNQWIPAPSAPPVPGHFHFSRAQAVAGPLEEAIRRVCRDNPSIAACYLLDADTADNQKPKVLIVLTIDDEARHMDSIAWAFQAMLRQFPEQAETTIVTSSGPFLPAYEDTRFYSR
jgi:hypothetical protein